MLTLDTDDLITSLKEYKKLLIERLEIAVRSFSYRVILTAIETTPLGDASMYLKWYERRHAQYGLLPEEGFARGSWQISKSGLFTEQEIYGVGSGEQAAAYAQSDLSEYRLGNGLYIGNNAFYIKALDTGYSKKASLGIMQPTMQQIPIIYSISFAELLKG